MTQIILASKSPYRKNLLSQILDQFECVNSQIDEAILKNQIKEPVELSVKLSQEKAIKVQERHKDSIIIGSDQVCYFNNQILGKPKTQSNAERMLNEMQGSSHQLITSYAIYKDSKIITHTNITTLTMRTLTPQQVLDYIKQDSPLDCAGSYKLEQKGIALFEKVETLTNQINGYFIGGDKTKGLAAAETAGEIETGTRE